MLVHGSLGQEEALWCWLVSGVTRGYTLLMTGIDGMLASHDKPKMGIVGFPVPVVSCVVGCDGAAYSVTVGIFGCCLLVR